VSTALALRALTYAPAGGTTPESERWTRPPGLRAFQRTVVIGHGPADWVRSTSAVLTWGVKTRSGFTVHAAPGAGRRVAEGADFWLVAAVGPFRVREPVRVVAVVDRPDRCGFAYGRLEGHPVSGEEAFVVHRRSDGAILLTLRSITGPSRGGWWVIFPALLIAQRWYRSRYVRALASR
jgi:uncharacterized protein (UPF0548 family)